MEEEVEASILRDYAKVTTDRFSVIDLTLTRPHTLLFRMALTICLPQLPSVTSGRLALLVMTLQMI